MNHSDTELDRRFLLEPTNERCTLIELARIEFGFFFKFSKLFRSIFSLFLSLFFFSEESKSSGGRSIIVASRLSSSCSTTCPRQNWTILKYTTLSLFERERERRERERRARRFGRRATTRASYPHTFVRELMILIHQPTFRFEEDEGYATRVLLINRSTPPRGGIASSNRPNSDEFLATDFAPLTQFFRPRKIEKTVAVGAAVAVFTTSSTTDRRFTSDTFLLSPHLPFYLLPFFLPPFFPAKGRGKEGIQRPERRSNVDQLESIVFAWK